jgi:hypothetical protein
VVLDNLSGGMRLPGRVICFGVDHPSPLWTESFVENTALIGRAYQMLEYQDVYVCSHGAVP